jgi:molecular chaperone HtpG
MTNADTDGFAVGVDFRRILDTIASRIYDNPFAFLRENVQNAIDAIRIQAQRDNQSVESAEYRIDVSVTANECRIIDSGNGMTKQELQINFWTMGASGKTTAEAQRAGCIGTFGIGGFANFGICSALVVISRSSSCATAHKTSLSRSDFNTSVGQLPLVKYEVSDKLKKHGTIVIGTADSAFNATALRKYLVEFVEHVREAVYFNNVLISRKDIAKPGDNYRALTQSVSHSAGGMSVTFQLFADDGNNLAVQLQGLVFNRVVYSCRGFVRLVNGSLDVFKNGFKLCAVSVGSRIGVSGVIDSDLPKPTAGRDTLDVQSTSALTALFRIVETCARSIVVTDEELLAAHIRLLPDILSSGQFEKLELLRISALDGETYLLGELKVTAKSKQRIYYSYANRRTPASEVMQARGDIVVYVSGDGVRRRAEIEFLQRFCSGIEFDSLIERLEPYSNLDNFERTVLAELDLAIRKLFNPEPFRFLAGRLTLDVPIFWSGKKENGQVLVYVDTRHGEFAKLRPLGYSPLLWSMMEAFCREYLGDTLKRQSTKFFGTGAIDLDTYAKSHAELWELVSTEIETSLLAAPANWGSGGRSGGRVEIVRAHDVTQVQISNAGGTPETIGDDVATAPGKLLHIVDDTELTGLDGYYIRIPASASVAFGEIIRGFPAIGVLWFANRITWSATDQISTAFLFSVRLDRMMGMAGEPSHGSFDIPAVRLQDYKGQIYMFIPPALEEYLVPQDDKAIRVEVTHELVDLERPRAWIAKETGASPT